MVAKLELKPIDAQSEEPAPDTGRWDARGYWIDYFDRVVVHGFTGNGNQKTPISSHIREIGLFQAHVWAAPPESFR